MKEETLLRKLLFFILSTFFLFSMLTGCANKETIEKNNQLTYGIEFEIEKINPILDEEQEIDSLLFRGLTKPSKDRSPEGDLAKNWTVSEDGKTYVFYLHEQAKFSDGEEVTAQDVKFTLDQILDTKTNTPLFSDFEPIEYVEATSKHVVTIFLKYPYPAILDKLHVGIVPKYLLQGQNMNKTTFNQNPIGNGPYKIKEWKKDKTIVLEKNPYYYGTKPKIEEIVFKYVPDPNARLMQLKTGEIDLAYLEANQMKSIKKTDDITVHRISTADYRALMYNFQHPLFQDANVRQALNKMVNKQELVNGILQGNGEVAYGPLQRSWVHAPSIEKETYNQEEAAKLLKEAGWKKNKDGILEKDGKTFSFDIVAPSTDPIRIAIAQSLATTFKQYGIEAKPQIKDFKSLDISKEDTFVIGWGSPFDPDDHTYRIFHSSQMKDGLSNFGHYKDPLVDETLGKARQLSNQEERKQLYQQFQEQLTVNPPFNFLMYVDALYGANKSVKGISDSTLGHHGYGIMWNIESWEMQ